MNEIPTVYPIKIPVVADLVLGPIVIYNEEFTSINFETEDELFGRITFQNLDAIKICRGEIMPYHDLRQEFEDFDPEIWVYKVSPSSWLNERYQYEKKHYENSYEFGNSVEEMLTDFSHYLFSFHDQFVEVIAKGFWFEKSNESLVNQPLLSNHPFLKFNHNFDDYFTSNNKNYGIKYNKNPLDQLHKDAEYCHQKLAEIWVIHPNQNFLESTIKLKKSNHKIITYWQPSFGKAKLINTEITGLLDIKNFLINN